MVNQKLPNRPVHAPTIDRLLDLIRPRAAKKTPDEAAGEVAREIYQAVKKRRLDELKGTIQA
jgi:predicted transcriptional regulator